MANPSVGAIHKLGVPVGSPRAAMIHSFSGDRFPAAPITALAANPSPRVRPTFQRAPVYRPPGTRQLLPPGASFSDPWLSSPAGNGAARG